MESRVGEELVRPNMSRVVSVVEVRAQRLISANSSAAMRQGSAPQGADEEIGRFHSCDLAASARKQKFVSVKGRDSFSDKASISIVISMT